MKSSSPEMDAFLRRFDETLPALFRWLTIDPDVPEAKKRTKEIEQGKCRKNASEEISYDWSVRK